jgi:hypothetical protein
MGVAKVMLSMLEEQNTRYLWYSQLEGETSSGALPSVMLSSIVRVQTASASFC